MNLFSAAELITQPWFITQEYALGFAPLIQSIISGQQLGNVDYSLEREQRAPVFISAAGAGSTVNGWNHVKAEKDSVAILRMKGPILKDSQMCGPVGTTEIANLLYNMIDNPNITGAVIRGESGGGQAYAVKPVADAMQEFRKSKPVVMLAEDIFASAMYYIGVYANEIVADNPKSIIGSVGTLLDLMDIKPALERQGVKFHSIYASASTSKNSKYLEALRGNYKPILEDYLDPFNDGFVEDVKEQRHGRIQLEGNKIFNGETYFATEAKELGMIDHLGNQAFAISRVRELAKSKPKSVYINNPNNNANMKFPKLTALAGVAQPTAEQLEEVNTELAEAGITGAGMYQESVITDAAAVTTERDNLRTELTTAQASVTTLTTQVENLTTENTGLKAKIAQGPAAVAPVVPAADPVTEPSAAEQSAKTINSLPHNQGILNNPLFAK